MTARRHLHLSLNVSGVGRHTAAWAHPASEPGAELRPDHYVTVAQLAEQGLFDAVFLADSPALGADERSIPYRFEPLTLLTALALGTERVGLIGTVSTTYNDPLDVADRAASLQTISGGRAAVNAVASTGDRLARNFGLDRQPDHGRRYENADAFLTTVRERWAAVPDTGHGRPLIVQAGGSARGRDLAARQADVVYAGGYGIEDARALDADVRARAAGHGRDPRALRVLPGVIPYLAETTAEAHRLADELDAVHRGVIDPTRWLGQVVGADLTGHDPDGPLPVDALPTDPDRVGGASIAGLARTLAVRGGLTIRQVAERLYAGGFGNIQTHVHGTAEEIADTLTGWFRQGVDGFNLLLPLQPSGVERFVERVVPLLQRAGVYRAEYAADTLAGHLGLVPEAAGAIGGRP